MCFSAQVEQRYRTYVRRFGADIDIAEFVRRYGMRLEDPRVKMPRGMDLAFLDDDTPSLEPVRDLIRQWEQAQATLLERELFAQRKRVVDAERALSTKVTKKAQEDVRIGTSKAETAQRKLGELKRTEPKARDSRIFPGVDALVLIVRDNTPTVLPMRYLCRPAGKPASYDTRYPGTYNARRDSLSGYWKGQFGHTHGLVIAHRFYENVEAEGGGNAVLEFTPDDDEPMLLACLWSHWTDPKGQLPDLYSFAAITDEPPPEVAAAGHDRCIIPIKAGNMDAWLRPDASRLDDSYAILDDRHRPYFEHRQAA